MIRYSLFLLALLLIPINMGAQGFTYKQDSIAIHVYEETMPVLTYQTHPASIEGLLRPAHYIHPLYGLDGEILTEDFPEDHPHHRGVFWAWHQVLVDDRPMGDAWECRDFRWDVQKVSLQAADTSLTMHTRVLWESPDLVTEKGLLLPFMEEQSRIVIHPRSEGHRVIDFDISLRALQPNLTLGGSEDAKGYGGFSVRMKLPDGIRFYSRDGQVTPTETAVHTGSWININGALGAGGSTAGLLIYDRNQGPEENTPWILREKRSMQNAVFPGRTPIPISMEKPTVLHYRLVVYKGQLSRDQIKFLEPRTP